MENSSDDRAIRIPFAKLVGDIATGHVEGRESDHGKRADPELGPKDRLKSDAVRDGSLTTSKTRGNCAAGCPEAVVIAITRYAKIQSEFVRKFHETASQ